MYASAGEVCASVLGVTRGPSLAGLLQVSFRIHGFTFNEQLPEWVMAAAWLLYLLWLCFSFKEPSHEQNADCDSIGRVLRNAPQRGINQPLPSSSGGNRGDKRGSRTRKATMSATSACSLLAPSVKLLSRLISLRFSQGSFNSEVLATEVGQAARVVADVSINLFGHMDSDRLVNLSLGALLLCISSIVATFWTLNSLY